MPKNSSQSTNALPARDAALGVAFSTLAALALIAALGALATLTPRAHAAKALVNLDHRFPVPSPHTYGDGFGAGRGHQGQDVFADCGKRVLAARKGRVQFKGRHSAAGNYLVIDASRTRVDYVYMHLRRYGMPGKGDSVETGQRIGKVGRSGNASGCHLHFELWSKPGWYEGGHAKSSVTKHLRRWDRASG